MRPRGRFAHSRNGSGGVSDHEWTFEVYMRATWSLNHQGDPSLLAGCCILKKTYVGTAQRLEKDAPFFFPLTLKWEFAVTSGSGPDQWCFSESFLVFWSIKVPFRNQPWHDTYTRTAHGHFLLSDLCQTYCCQKYSVHDRTWAKILFAGKVGTP